MKVKSDIFINHIKKASIEGLINEAVLDDKLNFAVTDDARSVVAISNNKFVNASTEFGKVGLYDLGLLIKSIQFCKGVVDDEQGDIEVVVKDNKLLFKKGDNEVKFLLSNPKVISSTIENSADVLRKFSSTDCIQVVVDNKDIDSILKAISLLNPEVITLVCSKKKVMCFIGKETEHNVNLKMGTYANNGDEYEMSLKFKPDLFSKVLTTISGSNNNTFELRKDFPIVIRTDEYTWIVAPLKE